MCNSLLRSPAPELDFDIGGVAGALLDAFPGAAALLRRVAAEQVEAAIVMPSSFRVQVAKTAAESNNNDKVLFFVTCTKWYVIKFVAFSFSLEFPCGPTQRLSGARWRRIFLLLRRGDAVQSAQRSPSGGQESGTWQIETKKVDALEISFSSDEQGLGAAGPGEV